MPGGLPSDALRHALAAEEFGRAASLLERAGRAMLTTMLTTSPTEFLKWLKALPDGASVMFTYLYVDVIGFFKPGGMQDVPAGVVWSSRL
ncbi:MAG TPA: hypothetical protein VGL99_25225, partial [Chloroflexota bacterium]